MSTTLIILVSLYVIGIIMSLILLSEVKNTGNKSFLSKCWSECKILFMCVFWFIFIPILFFKIMNRPK